MDCCYSRCYSWEKEWTPTIYDPIEPAPIYPPYQPLPLSTGKNLLRAISILTLDHREPASENL